VSLKPIKRVRVGEIEEPPLRLREMDEDMVRSLVMSLSDFYVEPIQVVETPGGKYRIVNGWHRFIVLRDVFKAEEIDVIVIGRLCREGEDRGSGCMDEFDYWLNAIRLNSIHGKWAKGALSQVLDYLLKEAKKRGLSERLLRERLGLYSKSRRAQRPKDEKEKMIKRVCSEVAHIGHEELGAGVIAFTYRGKLNLIIPLDKETYAQISLLISKLASEGKSLGEWLREKISSG
jgi:hypothetical protein